MQALCCNEAVSAEPKPTDKEQKKQQREKKKQIKELKKHRDKLGEYDGRLEQIGERNSMSNQNQENVLKDSETGQKWK